MKEKKTVFIVKSNTFCRALLVIYVRVLFYNDRNVRRYCRAKLSNRNGLKSQKRNQDARDYHNDIINRVTYLWFGHCNCRIIRLEEHLLLLLF